MDKVWNQQVAAPGIHSKYWVDQIARSDPGQESLERAYRDFGYEVAVQVEDMAFEIYENPDKNHERERLDWLLRFSKWFMKPGKFENFRIGMRVEDAATMPLHRMVFSLEIPPDEIESYAKKFTLAKASVPVATQRRAAKPPKNPSKASTEAATRIWQAKYVGQMYRPTPFLPRN